MSGWFASLKNCGIKLGSRGMGADILLYTSPGCTDCEQVRRFLTSHRLRFKEFDLSDERIAVYAKKTYGVRIAPITVIGDQVLYGSFSEQYRQLSQLSLGKDNAVGDGGDVHE